MRVHRSSPACPKRISRPPTLGRDCSLVTAVPVACHLLQWPSIRKTELWGFRGYTKYTTGAFAGGHSAGSCHQPQIVIRLSRGRSPSAPPSSRFPTTANGLNGKDEGGRMKLACRQAGMRTAVDGTATAFTAKTPRTPGTASGWSTATAYSAAGLRGLEMTFRPPSLWRFLKYSAILLRSWPNLAAISLRCFRTSSTIGSLMSTLLSSRRACR